jgi:hypothetical protein
MNAMIIGALVVVALTALTTTAAVRSRTQPARIPARVPVDHTASPQDESRDKHRD